MAEESKSKQQKPEEDRISTLPDHLLLHILSFVQSKTSVQTSILSPRWRHIWQHLSVLNVSDDDFIKFYSEPFKHFRRFFYFVNSLIYVLRPYNVEKMRLSCTKSLTKNKMCTTSINYWINSAIGPLIKELDITLYTIDHYCFRLPENISECTNLVSLSLEGALGFDLPQAKGIRLPSLKKLRLGICGMDVASLNAFLHGCPCLETLDLYLNVQDYCRICVPPLCLPSSLKRLKIAVNKFKIRTSLKTEVLLLDNLSISDAGKLQNAFLYASNASAFTLRKLLHALSGIKHAELNRSSTKWLLGNDTHLNFPNFGHLLHLNLNPLWFNANSLMSLLQECHLLEALIIQNDKEVCNDKEQSFLSKWTAQPCVPSCLESHLSFIQFTGYRGSIDELFFAKYILQNGRVLKTMIIVDISAHLKEKLDNIKSLSNVPRASEMCQLTFN